MLYFPKNDDTRALKILIKKDIINYDGKEKSLRTGIIRRIGTPQDDTRDYDYNFTYENISFDNEFIYKDGQLIALAELLLHSLIPAKLMDDTVQDIIESRNLKLVIVEVGWTEPIWDNYESIDSIDHKFKAYEVVTEAETV